MIGRLKVKRLKEFRQSFSPQQARLMLGDLNTEVLTSQRDSSLSEYSFSDTLERIKPLFSVFPPVKRLVRNLVQPLNTI